MSAAAALTGAPVPVYDEPLAVAQWLEARTGHAGEYGREVVEADGGRVALVPLLAEKSTSALVERIRRR